MAKDYYKILGVNKTDSKETIKKAYRDAVKQLHPDVSGGVFDKKRFYEIQEAYETLGDEEKRRMYDSKNEGSSRRRMERYGNFFSWTSSPFDNLFAWMEGRESFSPRERATDTEIQYRVAITLTGEEAWRGGEITLNVPFRGPCPFCGGRGRVELFSCPVCGGSGDITENLPLNVSIPPKVKDGTVLRVPFRGPDGKRHALVAFIEVKWFAETV
jgi:DnaJ-class molecular chaperone